MKYIGKNGLEVNGKKVWHEGNFNPAGKAEAIHNHTKNQITDFPSSLPANGGNADTIDGKHYSDITNYVDNGIDGIKIGGRNLIPINEQFWERGAIASANGNNTTSSTRLRTIGALPADSEQNYYLSISSEHNLVILAYDEEDNYLGYLSGTVWITQSTLLKSPLGTAKFRFVLAKKNNSTINLDELMNVTIKLEKGNKATDWTPAPEDVQAEIDGKVDNSKVLTDVPANAKFTDTVYTHPATHPPSIIVQDANNRFVTDAEKATWNGKEPAFTKNTAFNKNFGTAAGTVCQGNDSRLSNARTPTTHTHTKSQITDMPTKLSQLTNDIGAGGGINIITSPTEPPGLATGDQWHKEI